MNTQTAAGERGHRPERDLRPRLRRRDVRRVGLRRRRRRRRGGRLARRPGRRRPAPRRASPPRSWPASRRPARRRRPRPRPRPPPRPSAARRSRERFSRCSGISVTRRHDRRHASARADSRARRDGPTLGRARSARPVAHDRRRRVDRLGRTCAQPRRTATLACQTALRARRAVRLRFVRTFTSGRVTHRPTAATVIRRPPRDRTTTRTSGKATPARCSPSTSSKWPGINVAFLVSFFAAIAADARRHPVRQAPPGRQAALVGRGDARRRLRLRRDVPRLRRRAPPVDRPRRQEPRLEQGQASSTARAASSSRRRPAGGSRSRCSTRRSATSSSSSSTSSSSGCSSSSGAGGRSAARRTPTTEIETSIVRPSAGEEGADAMARTDANPPMMPYTDEYPLVEVDADYLTKAVKPKQFIHIDQTECIMCEGCVDICPWKCIHMVTPERDRRGHRHRAARRGPVRQGRVHHRRRHLHPLRAVRRPVPDRRDHPRQGRRRRAPPATPTPAPTTTATPTA